MSLLLDTHVFLWWIGDDAKLNATARAAIENPGNMVLVSAASVWEISIKASLGKIDIHPDDVLPAISDSGFGELPIGAVHALRAGTLPPHHRDPFDRMLAAQALGEGLTLVSHDRQFQPYDVRVLWT